jgi:outer membrane receptor protein involved in Fe transport
MSAWVAVFGLLLAFTPVAAQEGALRGTVLAADGRIPVAGATILVGGTTLQVMTDVEGRFNLEGMLAGSYSVSAVAPGFAETTITDVEIVAGQAGRLEIVLERAVFDMPSLLVTANRSTTRPGDAPVSVAVITGEEIRRRNVISLEEALPFAQGVTFNAGQMDIRGASGLARGVGSRVLMLLDGQRVLSGVGGAIEFDALPVMDVERVEIVKGPNSTLYGTNALGGVVNVITRRPPEQPETLIRAYYGFFDTPSDFEFTDEQLSMEGLNIQHSRRLGEVGTTLFVGREASDGFRQNGEFERWKVRAKGVFPVESANPWELWVSWTREDEQEFFTWLSEDRPLEVDPVELGDWAREDDVAFGITATPLVTPDLRLQIRPQIYHSRVQNHFHDNETFHSSTRYGTDLQISFYPTLDHAITMGGEAALTPVTSDFVGEPTVTDLAVFAQDEIVLTPKIKGSIGVRLDYHKASTAEEDLQLNPKVALVVQPSDRVSIRASVSRGYRAPSVSEQFTNTTQFGFRVIPNLTLGGESAWAGEVGATASVGSRVWFDAGAFWSEYSNLIEPGPVQGEFLTFQFQNVSEARVRGLDLGVRVGIIQDQLNLGVNYLFLDTKDKLADLPLPYRSDHNVTATLSALHDRIGLDLRFRSEVEQVLAFPLDDRSPITTVDLRYGQRFLGMEVQAKRNGTRGRRGASYSR